MSMRAAESRTLTAGSAFNEPVWATVLLDRRLSQATMIGIKGEAAGPASRRTRSCSAAGLSQRRPPTKAVSSRPDR